MTDDRSLRHPVWDGSHYLGGASRAPSQETFAGEAVERWSL